MHALFISLAVIGIMVYALCYILGGPWLANSFIRMAYVGIRRAVTALGLWLSRASNRHPLAAGIIFIFLVLVAMSRC